MSVNSTSTHNLQRRELTLDGSWPAPKPARVVHYKVLDIADEWVSSASDSAFTISKISPWAQQNLLATQNQAALTKLRRELALDGSWPAPKPARVVHYKVLDIADERVSSASDSSFTISKISPRAQSDLLATQNQAILTNLLRNTLITGNVRAIVHLGRAQGFFQQRHWMEAARDAHLGLGCEDIEEETKEALEKLFQKAMQHKGRWRQDTDTIVFPPQTDYCVIL